MKPVLVGEREIWCVDRGAGPVVLLVHGFPLDHSMWSWQIDVLAEKHRVIVPDLPGFGRSPTAGETMTMAAYADELAGLLDALQVNEPVVFCGLSMGGYIAFSFVQRHAERLRGLVLCDTRAAADSSEAAANRYRQADQVLREGPGQLAETMLPRLLAASTAAERPELLASLRQIAASNSAKGVAAALRGMAERADMTARLGQIACPTLVMVGADDGFSTPEEMRKLAAAIPQSRFIEIPRGGHLAPLENPAAANQALSGFLDAL